MEYTPFEKLELFEGEFILLEKLWCGRKEWVDNYAIWDKQQYLKVELEAMGDLCEKLQKAANLCAKELEINDMAKLFKQDIEDFKSIWVYLFIPCSQVSYLF